jgi:4-hydroxy-tetrahydrodipicolinate synthase
MTENIGGVFPVLPTPFTANGAIDEQGLRNVIGFVVKAGVDGVVFAGLASEYDCLTLEERLHLIEVVGDEVRGRCRFIVGASSDRVDESAVLIEAGAAAGASAAMVMTPRTLDGDFTGLTNFYRSLGELSGLPIMVQNAPKPMGLGLDVDDVCRLIEAVPSVRYVKEENMPCGARITALREQRLPRLEGVFGGAGGRYVIDELVRGASGTMPAAELPHANVMLNAAWHRGDIEAARSIHERILPILMMQAVFRWALTKEVLKRTGLIESAFIRARGPSLDKHDHVELTVLLNRIGDLTAVSPRHFQPAQ